MPSAHCTSACSSRTLGGPRQRHRPAAGRTDCTGGFRRPAPGSGARPPRRPGGCTSARAGSRTAAGSAADAPRGANSAAGSGRWNSAGSRLGRSAGISDMLLLTYCSISCLRLARRRWRTFRRFGGAGRRDAGDLAGRALAAVLGQIAQQAAHAREVGAVDQVAALLFDADQSGMRQLLQVEGQRIAGDVELPAMTLGVRPSGPATTRARNTRRRWAWARAPRAATVWSSFIIQSYNDY